MAKEKETTEWRQNSYTPSRMDDVLDAGQKMLDDAKKEEASMQSAQSKADEIEERK